MIRQWVKRMLLERGIVISRPPGQFKIPSKLKSARDRGLEIRFAIDGGAAVGEWVEEFKEIYPNAQVLCVEPRDDAQEALRALAARLPGIQIAQVLLGESEGEVEFFVDQDQSSLLPKSGQTAQAARVKAPMTTLDQLIESRKLPYADLIKLDLQGAELRCLRGATRCLERAQAVLLEVTFIPFMKGMPLIEDVVPFMSERGFRLYDILALWHRPLDGALGQGDFLFVSNRNKLTADPRWDISDSPR